MAEVKNAQDATEIAYSFLKEYFSYVRPIKAVREGDIWLVEVDIGPLIAKVARCRIDASSGEILEYTTPS